MAIPLIVEGLQKVLIKYQIDPITTNLIVDEYFKNYDLWIGMEIRKKEEDAKKKFEETVTPEMIASWGYVKVV